jgi:hypothetical protein
MKVKLILIAVAIVLLSVVALLVFVSRPTNVLNQQLLGECNVPYPPELPTNSSHKQQFAVLLLRPNSSARICVGYSSLSPSPVELRLQASVIGLDHNVEGVTLSAQPLNLTVPGNNNNVSPVGVAYAAYTIRLANNSKGFYILELPGFCPTIPVAIGYSSSEVNATVFSGWLAGNYACGPERSLVEGWYVSVSNVDVAYPYSY